MIFVRRDQDTIAERMPIASKRSLTSRLAKPPKARSPNRRPQVLSSNRRGGRRVRLPVGAPHAGHLGQDLS